MAHSIDALIESSEFYGAFESFCNLDFLFLGIDLEYKLMEAIMDFAIYNCFPMTRFIVTVSKKILQSFQ